MIKSKISSHLNFVGVENLYFVAGNRKTVVFLNAKTRTYSYCDVEGVEDHRLIVSAKGPFDKYLPMDSFGHPWHMFEVDESTFDDKTNVSFSELRIKLIKNAENWRENLVAFK